MRAKLCVGVFGSVLTAAVLWGAFGCNGDQSRTTPTTVPIATQRSVTLVPYRDPWRHARPRMWDIADHPFVAFIKAGGFDYSKPHVVLRYETSLSTPYFTGSIEAQGLKPNFAYQMKLAGKPVKGSRGWGRTGDDLANSRLGVAGRWWCDSTHEGQASFDDKHYQRYYLKAKPGQEHNMYGYLFLGSFVTDQHGNANFSFKGAHSYHITWRDEQGGHKEVVAGSYVIGSTGGYGYGSPIAPKNVKLWYEYQPNRPHNIHLPKGSYHCRLLLTEETFHNLLGGTKDINGGYWQTVMATEDFDAAGKPDGDAGNDVAFTIR